MNKKRKLKNDCRRIEFAKNYANCLKFRNSLCSNSLNFLTTITIILLTNFNFFFVFASSLCSVLNANSMIRHKAVFRLCIIIKI